MKRIKSACMCETLHFILDMTLPIDISIAKVKEEVEALKNKASDNLKIISIEPQEDNSVIVVIKKKVSNYDIGNYFD